MPRKTKTAREIITRADARVEFRPVGDTLRPFVIEDKKIDEAAWAPMPGGQSAFLDCPGEVTGGDGVTRGVYEALATGNRGGGKTECLGMIFGRYVGGGFGEHWRGIISRQNVDDLRDLKQKLEALFPEIWPELRGGNRLESGEKVGFNYADDCWVWPTGERLFLRHLEKSWQFRRYKGWELPFQGWEELTQWPNDELYLQMQSTSRSPIRGIPLMVRGTTNPDGVGRDWVKFRFRLPIAAGRVIGRPIHENGHTRLAIRVRLEDNLVLRYTTPNYMQTIAQSATSESQLRAWRDEDWDAVPGGMFGDLFDAGVHLVEPFEIPKSWRIDRSFDWGSAKPFSVGWWAESDGTDYRDGRGRIRASVRGDLFRIAEWYGWTGRPNVGLGITNHEIGRGIVEREVAAGRYGVVQPGPADCQIFKRENRPSSIADEMMQNVMVEGRSLPGPRWNRADQSPGSRVPGWAMVRSYLENAKPPAHGGPREFPGLFAFSTCEQFKRLFPATQRDDRNRDDVDKGSEDHLQDEVRYRVKAAGTVVSDGTVIGMY